MAVVDLDLRANLDKATKNIDGFAKKGASALLGLAAAFASAFAVKKVTEAAAIQEAAVQKMNAALALTGDYSAVTSQRLQDFASNLQKNSTIGDEVALSLVGLTKSMGATNEQTEKIIQTAADLSAVTGESLETSVRNLTKTLGGMKGELGETQPELRNLTKEQLKNGEGIDILAKKYAGMAKEMTNTFAGAMKQTQNSFGDLLEEVGFLITQNPLVIEAIKETSKAFQDLGAWIKDNRVQLIELGASGIVAVVRGLALFIDAISDTVSILANFNAVIDFSLLKLGEFSQFLVKIANTVGPKFANSMIRIFERTINLGIKPLLAPVQLLSMALSHIGVISEASNQAIQNLGFDGQSNIEQLTIDVENFTNAAREGFIESTDGLLKTKDGFDTAGDAVRSYADKLDELKKSGLGANTTLEKLSKTNQKIRAEAEANKAFADKTFFGGSITGQDIIGGASTAVTSLTKGAAGANELLSAGVGAAANAFLPGSGAAASALSGLLAQGPEATKAMVQGFVEQIPVIIENLVDAMPVLVETLIVSLAENADKIIVALVRATPKLAAAIAYEVPLALARALPNALGGMLKDFVDSAKKAFEDLFGGLTPRFDKLVSGLDIGFDNLFTKMGEAFDKIVTDIPQKIFDGIQTGIDKLMESVGNALASILGDKVTAAILDLKNGIADSLKNLGIDIVNAVKEALNEIGDVKVGGTSVEGIVEKLSGGIVDGGSKVEEKARKIFGYALGGEIPAGFPNDTFPARLSSGENVVDRSTNEKLNAFLDRAGSPTKVVLQVGERELASVMLDLNRQGFRTA